MCTRRFSVVAMCLLGCWVGFSQSGIRIAQTPIPEEPGAILQVESADQGVLIPRTLTTSVLSPVEGLMIYDTVQHRFMYYNGAAWTSLMPAAAFQFAYADRDADGFGDKFSALYAPSVPMGYVANDQDCEDLDPDIYPGATELCDGQDNDCDGSIDEMCIVDSARLVGPAAAYILPGETPDILGQVVLTGVTDSPGQGGGVLAEAGYGPEGSDPDGGGWDWVPANYLNDGGSADIYTAVITVLDFGEYDFAYRFSADAGTTWTYGDLNGSQDGYQVAQAGQLVVLDDICNGIDDDQDGNIDEHFPDLGQPCDGPDEDFCAEGFIVCFPNGGAGCSDDTPSTLEVCNGMDDDCDGETDEGCIDWCNLQFPFSIEMAPGISPDIFGQVYEFGVTDQGGQGAGIIGEVGFGPDGSEPWMAGWTWFPTVFNTDVGNNDEYIGTIEVTGPGTYDYAYRFSLDAGVNWLYGDSDGSSNGYQPANAGHLVVSN